MLIEFAHPLRLLLIPACAAVILAVALLQRSRSRKEKISHLLRYLLAVLTVLAMAGTSLSTASQEQASWLLIDISDSMQQEEALSLARQALHTDRKTGVIVFGRNAAVERSMESAEEPVEIHSMIRRDGSDLGEALALASALIPGDVNAGIAVISDGRVTGGEFTPSVPVNTLRTGYRTGQDAQVTQVAVPASLYTGQRYTTLVTVHANAAGEATLMLTENHGEPRAQQVILRKGENTFAYDSVASSGGVISCEARIMMPGDTVPANDKGSAFTVISGEPAVLIAEGKSGEGEALRNMLESASMHTTVIPASMLSEQASGLWAYQAIALVNVDASMLSDAQITALSSAVREMGCGLAVFGGDSSFALGGYRGSELEKILPVNIDVRNRMDLPTTALIIAIDKSGSMADEAWGLTREDVAREAACSALDVLTERDQAGVIAFDDTAKWVVPMARVTDPEAMQSLIRTIRPDGGTAFYSPLVMAYEALKTADARYRHLIFLTDGEAGDTGYMPVVREMAEAGITVTTVAVGDGADYAGMRAIAEAGGGRAYTAGPFDSLPKIFTKETMLISGSYVQNRVFTPVVTDTAMTDFSGFPTLTGYLAATEKPLATVSLCSDRQDPVLAWWQYGAGRVAAWMSDVQGGWSRDFLTWDDAPAFFGGIMSWVMPVYTPAGVAELENGKLRFIANDLPEEATRAEAQIVRPDGSVETVMLEQVSADTFEGPANTEQAGAYALHLTVSDPEGQVLLAEDTGAVISWTHEYDLRESQEGVLENLSEKTGGRVVNNPEELLIFPDTAARKRMDLAPYLMLLAGILFLFDIAQRRLDLFRDPDKSTSRTDREEAKQPETKAAKQPTKQPEQPQAAQLLWQNMQKKKRL